MGQAVGHSTSVAHDNNSLSWGAVLRKDMATIIVAALAIFIPGLGRVHLFDWDEINFAEAAREMLVTHDYLHVRVNFLPFAEKPPLFMWLQAAAMHVFGINEFAARLPNVFVGIVALVAMYYVGGRLRDRRFGMLWVVAYVGSFLPHLYFRSGIIDPVFNAFIFAGVCALFAGHRTLLRNDSRRALTLFAMAGAAIGLAVLTKGPVALLLSGMTWMLFLLVRKPRTTITVMLWPAGVFLAGVAVTSLPWYVAVAISDGGQVLNAFIARQLELLRTGVAGHTGPWYYHIVVLLVGCFPASIFAFAGTRREPIGTLSDASRVDDFRLWMMLLFAVVLVIFSIVQTKIIHYSSLAYFPITFLAANALYRLRGRYSTAILVSLASVGALWAILLTAVPLIGKNAAVVAPYVRDVVVRASLALPVDWSYGDVLIGVGYLGAITVAIMWAQKIRRNPSTHQLPRSGVFVSDAPALLMFAATAGTLIAAAAVLFPKVEAYSQGTPIAFYNELRGRDVYVTTLTFKSYAQLFYTDKTADVARSEECGATRYADSMHLPRGSSLAHEEWLLHGAIDRTAYFVAKVNKAEQWRGVGGLRELRSSGGFTFFQRDAVAPLKANCAANLP